MSRAVASDLASSCAPFFEVERRTSPIASSWAKVPLPASVAYLPPRDELLDMLHAAGFADARRISLSGGVSQLLVGTRA